MLAVMHTVLIRERVSCLNSLSIVSLSNINCLQIQFRQGDKKHKEWINVAWERSLVVSFACLWPLLLTGSILSLCALISEAMTRVWSSELHLPFKCWGKWPATAPGRRRIMCMHTHSHTKLQSVRDGAVLTCPLSLPKMSSRRAAANSPFWPETLPEANNLQWSTNGFFSSICL